MRAARFYGRENIRVEDVDEPAVGAGEVLLRVKAASICGTDRRIYRGRLPVKKTPIIMGHEYAGVVGRVGEAVDIFAPGDRVIGSPVSPCGRCAYCGAGRPQLCVERVAIGIEVDGSFAEEMSVPRAEHTLQRLPDDVSFEEGALVGDLLSTAVHGVEMLQTGENSSILIVGDGPVALASVMVAKARRVGHVALVGKYDERLDLARRLGADLVVNGTREEPSARVKAATGGLGVDGVVDAVGNQDSLNHALNSMRRGGRISLVGIFEAPAILNMRRIVNDEVELYGSFCPAGESGLKRTLALLQEGQLNLKSLISHTLGIEEVARAFTMMDRKLDNVVKVVIRP